jgi:hypothetical protein
MWIFSDPLYRQCIELAMSSPEKEQRYGAVLVKDGKVIGRGFNRKRKGTDLVDMGDTLHAEGCAVTNAGKAVDGAWLYVAGYFVEPGTLSIRDRPLFTCVKCPPALQQYGLAGLHVPTKTGWGALSMHEAHMSAEQFQAATPGANRYEQRLHASNSGITIDEFILRTL